MDLHGFELRDRMRRKCGRQLERMGWGPQQTPSTLAFRAPGVSLKAYAPMESGPVVVLVPAPIKRSYIWDLAPRCSVVRALLEDGCRVYLLEWDEPGEQSRGLADYAERLILEPLDAIAGQLGERSVFLAGHSLGGTLAAIFATLHPERVSGLILLGSPVHFDPATDVFAPLLTGLVPERLPAGNVPGSFLNTVTWLAAPLTIGCAPWLDRLANTFDREGTATLMRVTRWAHDEMPLSGQLIADVVQRLYRDDAFMRGTLLVGERMAAPQRFNAPLLSIADPRCPLAPPQSVEPFHRRVGGTDTRLIHYSGDTGVLLQHVGMLVGRSAHRRLWPQILRWIDARSPSVH